ncbi:MAG: hypothetical protein HKN41_03105, partial [Ilumatobacter sp.]|nr:hypothetical protein [Ilumatobacter sp.]
MPKAREINRILRITIAAAMAVTLGVAIDGGPTTAVLLQDPSSFPDIPTGFELDGDKDTDGSDEAGTGVAFDWNDVLGAGVGPYSFSAGAFDYESTGVVASTFNTDVTPAACGGTTGDDGFGNGAKVDDNPWPVITTNVNKKADACSGATALEVMRVTDTTTGDDQLHYILYTYWTRSLDATGDMTVYQVFAGTNPDPNHRC